MARTDDTVHGAADDVIADVAPAQARDEFTERVFVAFEDDEDAPVGVAAGVLKYCAAVRRRVPNCATDSRRRSCSRSSRRSASSPSRS